MQYLETIEHIPEAGDVLQERQRCELACGMAQGPPSVPDNSVVLEGFRYHGKNFCKNQHMFTPLSE